MKIKIVVIVGPTTSGKSDVAVEIAQQCIGEVISADSRQVYRGLDVGSGKITREEMRGVSHHLLDIADPRERYSVANFVRGASDMIKEIVERKHAPIIAGGTGFFIHALIDDVALPEVPPNEILREKLKDKSVEELFAELKKKDPRRAETIDPKNPRRLIRALEIVDTLGSVPHLEARPPSGLYADYSKSPYDVLQIGLSVPDEILKERIHERTKWRLENGWVEEVSALIASDVQQERFVEFGLGYHILAHYCSVLQNTAIAHHSNILQNVRMTDDTKAIDELVKEIATAEWQYAKRQMTWFSRDSRIEWFPYDDTAGILVRAKEFLGS